MANTTCLVQDIQKIDHGNSILIYCLFDLQINVFLNIWVCQDHSVCIMSVVIMIRNYTWPGVANDVISACVQPHSHLGRQKASRVHYLTCLRTSERFRSSFIVKARFNHWQQKEMSCTGWKEIGSEHRERMKDKINEWKKKNEFRMVQAKKASCPEGIQFLLITIICMKQTSVQSYINGSFVLL